MSVQVIDTLKPKNGLDFPVVEAIDVAVEGYDSLADAVMHFATDTAIAALTAALDEKANTSDVNTAVANLRGQINQIVISASAESVVAPEVAAARVSLDGTENQTLKQRLDRGEKELELLTSSVAEEINTTLTLDIHDDGYYTKAGVFTPDTGRLYAIINVTPDEQYRISTFIKSTTIAGIIYRNSTTVLSYDLVGDGSGQEITDYNIIIPANCDNIIVQSALYTQPITVVNFYNRLYDAEVEAARVSEDGTSYATLKERLDAEEVYTQDIGSKVTIIDDHFVNEVDSAISLDIHDDGYYSKTGVFTSDTGRLYAIVDVIPGEHYKLTTYTKSSYIAGIIYRNNDTVLSYDLVGTNTGTDITDYEVIIPDNCDNIIVQSASYLKPIALNYYYNDFTENCDYKSSVTVYLGDDVLDGINGYFVPDTGWSGNKTDGYTHATGHADSLSFTQTAIEENAVYLLEFDTSFTDDEFVKVGIGNQYRILCYNGTSHITVPLLYESGKKTVYFTPLKNVSFTISNIKMRKIAGGTTEHTINSYNTLTNNHNKNYGFWNIMLGRNTAEKAVGTTRTLAIGYASMNRLQGGHRNVGVGTFTMSQMVGGENNIAIGADSMLAVQKANDCISIGKGTMYNGLLHEDDIAIGHYALNGSAESNNSKHNVAIGKNAGWYCYGQDNVYVGYQAGYKCKNTNGNICIGMNAYGEESGNHNVCLGEASGFANGASNSIAIGYNTKTTASNQVVIGNSNVSDVIFCGNKRIIFNQNGTVTWEEVE